MWHRSGPRRAVALLAIAPALLAADLPAGEVTARITGLRSQKGHIVACLTARAKAFPECDKDPRAIARIVPATGGAVLAFGPVPPGHYAISLFHDENGNGRLDRKLLLPSEGYGFSRDAPVRFGPPSFARAAFSVDGRGAAMTIRMRYLF